MKIARFSFKGRTKFGIVNLGKILELRYSPFFKHPQTDTGKDYFSGNEYSLAEVQLLPPCLPSKIICLGLNYRSHAKELEQKLPEVPLIFLKPSTSVIGPNESIVLPNGSERVDYEGELAIVIGRKIKGVAISDINFHILGYTCFNDITERVQQAKDIQWTRAKGYDTFAPIGPWIETNLQPYGIKIETLVNGITKQSGNTRDLIFDIPKIITFVAGIMTLLPGDLIATGTPDGIGPLKAGDFVEVKIEGIGTLSNRVVIAN